MRVASEPRMDAFAADPESDATLLELVQQKDDQAMARLFTRHSRLVYSVAVRVLKDASLAEDVLQEIFMQIWRKPVQFAPNRGSLAAYLAVSTRNRCIDLLRQQKPADDVADVQIASSYSLAGDAEHRILLERVKIAMNDLPGEQKRSLEMAFFDGLTHTEIAQQTGLPLGTIKTRIRAALQRLERSFQV